MIKKRTLKSGLILELDDELKRLCLHNTTEIVPDRYDFQDEMHADTMMDMAHSDDYEMHGFSIADAMKILNSIYNEFDEEFSLPVNWRGYLWAIQPMLDSMYERLDLEKMTSGIYWDADNWVYDCCPENAEEIADAVNAYLKQWESDRETGRTESEKLWKRLRRTGEVLCIKAVY